MWTPAGLAYPLTADHLPVGPPRRSLTRVSVVSFNDFAAAGGSAPGISASVDEPYSAPLPHKLRPLLSTHCSFLRRSRRPKPPSPIGGRSERLGGPAGGKFTVVCPLGVTEGGQTVSPGSAGHICGLAAVEEARSHQKFLAEVGRSAVRRGWLHSAPISGE